MAAGWLGEEGWRWPSGKELRQPGLGDHRGADVTGGSMCGCKIFGHHMLRVCPQEPDLTARRHGGFKKKCIIKNTSRSRAKLDNFYSLCFLSSFMSESEKEDFWAIVRRPCQLAALAQRWESGLCQRGAAQPQSETWSQGERAAAEAKRRDKRTE